MTIPIIQALYNPIMPVPKSITYYEELLIDIELFSVSSQVFHLLKESERLRDTPNFFQKRLKEKFDKVLYQNLFIKHEGTEILQCFEKKKIHVIPLKGIHFAEKYFGSFGARGTADIDLLVSPSDLTKAIRCLKSLGYILEKDENITNNHCSLTKSTSEASMPLSVEVHWNLEKEYSANIDVSQFWENTEKLSTFHYVKELSVQNTFYYTCLHGARHQMDSIKYFIDIIQMIHLYGEQIDYSALLIQAAKDRTLKKIKAVLTIVYDQFPELQEMKPFPFEQVKNLWQYNLIKNARFGNKSFHYYLYRIYFDYFLYDTWEHQFLSLKVVHYLYPPRHYLYYLMEIDNPSNVSLSKLYALLYKRKMKQFLQNQE